MIEDWQYEHSESEAEIDHCNTDIITCPYCGHEYDYNLSREMIGDTTNAWSWPVICEKCKKLFDASWDFEIDENEEITVFWTYHAEQIL